MSRERLLGDLRQAARKGDRGALELALADMRTLALSPRYWERYLALLRNPLARLVDLLVLKQGERIAHLKGWKLPKTPPAGGTKVRDRRATKPPRRRPRRRDSAEQTSLFELG